MKTKLRRQLIALTLLALATLNSTVFAQGTAFNYQGHLNAGGVAANGSYDLQFTLYSLNAGGVALAGPVTNSATAVSNGLFTTAIDFGPGVFMGESNWLDIAVRTNNVGGFTELTPRQQINPTPYAIYAEGAASAGSVAAGNITGIVPLTELPTVLVTNNASGLILSGTFLGNFGGTLFGNGAGLTALTPANLSAGTAAINISGNAATATTATTVAGLSNYWSLNGNNVGNGQFLGSTNDQALELHVDGERALQLIPDANNEGAPDFIAGSVGNYVAPGVVGAVVDGGATNYTGNNLFEFEEIDYTNSVLSDFSVVAGGVFNTAGAGGTGGATVSGGANNNAVNAYATVGGGENNNAVGLWSTVSGGNNNNADGSFYGATVVAGGSFNTAGADYATVGGGSANQALAYYSTVPGGANNLASGRYSFAAGQNAEATNTGAFVWADSQSAAFTSTNNDSFNVRAQGGVQLVTGGAGLTVDGQPVFAGSNGAGLTNLNASNLTGTLPLARLPAVVVTNNGTGVTLSGTFSGNGGGLTNLNASKLTSGTVPLAQFPSAVVTNNETSLTLSGNFTGSLAGNASAAATAGLATNVVLGINITNAFITGATLTNATLNFPSTMTINSGGMPIWYSDSAQNLILGVYGNYFSEIGQGAAANTSLGTYALEIISSGVGNTGIGDSALYSVNKGNYNTALGYEALDLLTTGSNNVAVGNLAGFGLMGNESNNIYIGNQGFAGENNTIRIGTNGVQTAAYIAGVINGNGGGLTNLNASKLASGTVPTNVLSGFQGPNYEAVGGGSGNTDSGPDTVIGGGVNNTVGYAFSTVGGGTNNAATGEYSTIAGGENNLANNFDDAVAGGQNNSATGGHSFVGGGLSNSVSYLGATVAGGQQNSATYFYATVPGGYFNLAGGYSSFAAGQFARATNNNTFVWSDGSATIGSITNNSVTMLSTNGYRFFTGTSGSIVFTNGNSSGSDQQVAWTPGSGSWAFTSDRNTKDRFETVDPESVLARVMELPVSEWSYKGFDQRHIGVMAQDFHAQFPLNGNDKALNDADLHGVELAAIQGLNQKVQQQEAENASLKQQNDLLEKRLDELEATVKQLIAQK